LEKSQSEETTLKLVESYNVRIDKSMLEFTNLAAVTPCILTCHLLKALFTFEELATSSLFGRNSNVKPQSPTLPPLDLEKRNAIFGK